MSSPAKRRGRGGQSVAGTPRLYQPAVSSPLFYQSPVPGSSPPGKSHAPGLSNSRRGEAGGGAPTPRALSRLVEASSPINYGTSSPARAFGSTPAGPTSTRPDLFSDDGGLFVPERRTPFRRGDIHPEGPGANRSIRSPRRAVIVNAAGETVSSEAMTFPNVDPNTSEADALGGESSAFIWGTTVSLTDTSHQFKEFLRRFKKRYRLYAEGLDEDDVRTVADAESNPYMDQLQEILMLGSNRLYLDVKDLSSYPPTRKLSHHLVNFPHEVIPILDQVFHDVIIDLARDEDRSRRTARARPTTTNNIAGGPSSEPLFFHSDIPTPAAHNPPQQAAQSSLEDEVTQGSYLVRIKGLETTVNLRELNPSDMDHVIAIKGLVIRTTPVIPDMMEAYFKCAVCNHSMTVDIDRGRIQEPTVCPRQQCETKNSMVIVHNRCIFRNKQVIKLQETPDAVPPGQTPHSVSVCAYDELVDFCKAGDRVLITGIFRVSAVRVNPRQRSVKAVHRTYVDALHIQKVDNKRMGLDESTLDDPEQHAESGAQNGAEDGNVAAAGLQERRKFTAEEVARIRSTAERPDVYELLARSLAPSIYEMDDVKKGVLLQLFGGTNKSFEKGGSPRYRGDINVLLCGDPSTSKSQLLQYVHKIAPRGVYTSGKGSSAVGLTAYVTRDPETRQLVLESGALVLSDGGVCCIDEFDKMNESTRSVLHEVMEQQTVSVAKAGIITTLNARTSILASANPIGSRYNPDLPVPQNIDLPPTLLSRFDLVYLILDRVDEKNDRRLARHLMSMYLEDKPQSALGREVLPVEFLTSYISYARSHVHPTISQPAAEQLVDSYIAMRQLGQGDLRSAASEKRITATTRQLESMIRLAEAHAKMRLSATVTRDDVLEADRLIRSALKTAATDAFGRIDMSLLTEGTSAADRQRRADLKAALVRVLDEMTRGGEAVRWPELLKKMSEVMATTATTATARTTATATTGGDVDSTELGETLRALEMEGKVMISGEGARRLVRRVVNV